MTKYILIEEAADYEYPVDTTMTVFDDMDDAVRTADVYYNSLSEHERNNRSVYVVVVTESDLLPHAKQADGSMDWTRFDEFCYVRSARLYDSSDGSED